jgi:hypothetical protein
MNILQRFSLDGRTYEVKKDYWILYITYLIENDEYVYSLDNKGRIMWDVKWDNILEKRIIHKDRIND